MLTTILAVVYSAVRAGSSTTFLSPPSSPTAGTLIWPQVIIIVICDSSEQISNLFFVILSCNFQNPVCSRQVSWLGYFGAQDLLASLFSQKMTLKRATSLMMMMSHAARVAATAKSPALSPTSIVSSTWSLRLLACILQCSLPAGVMQMFPRKISSMWAGLLSGFVLSPNGLLLVCISGPWWRLRSFLTVTSRKHQPTKLTGQD